MSTVSSMYDGIEDADVSEGGNYIKVGHFVGEIVEVKDFVTRKKIPSFRVVMTVVESDNPEQGPGSKVTWLQGADKDGYLGRIKGFIAPAMTSKFPETPTAYSDVTKDGLLLITGDTQPLAGVKIRYEGYPITTGKGHDITAVRFEAYIAPKN